ncbi:uncharacterized protein A1O5_02505 [Cladophialophora psammophila CBS 110553]|uniref:Uncharacterized protein n=1 Tax=Cladophialophora psammophila CBS 110553 TaxID=1182543 RepID=W9XA47_9EURO|nr:uncharacterized protein A1O5_02505 [Cladophialophora psammophila CBS 110553]EXJ74210.1 hypothetical protein A1O5_02505 [Cladophialophora psammophila CBS 110553]
MIQQREIARLRAFHAAHFSGQPIPDLVTCQQNPVDHTESSRAAEAIIGEENHDDDRGLGYYEDGAKRTLTDDQIKMFRHSEIQRLLSEKRAAKVKEETKIKMKESSGASPVTREPRKRRFEDEPAATQFGVDTLTYDEEPDTRAASIPVEKKFLWPVLGQNSK